MTFYYSRLYLLESPVRWVLHFFPFNCVNLPSNQSVPIKRSHFYLYEPFDLGRFATDHSQTKTALRSLFVRLIRLTSD